MYLYVYIQMIYIYICTYISLYRERAMYGCTPIGKPLFNEYFSVSEFVTFVWLNGLLKRFEDV